MKVDEEREVSFKEMVQRRMDDHNKQRDVKRGMIRRRREEKGGEGRGGGGVEINGSNQK